MDKKIFVTFLIALSVSGARARSVSSFTQVNDTIARDLSDLEAQLQDSVIPTDVDTNYYGVARQRNFNALKYVLDGRHRYPGDNFKNRSFWDHSYLELGAYGSSYRNNGAYKITPLTGAYLNFGKELSPMSTIRVGLGVGVSFLKGMKDPVYTNNSVLWTFSGNVDYLFNFSNYLLGYRPDRPFSVAGVVGLGYEKLKFEVPQVGGRIYDVADKSGNVFNFHTGLQFRFFAGSHGLIGIEPYVQLASDKHDLSRTFRNDRLDFSYGAKISYIYYFNSVLSEYGGNLRRHYLDGQRYFSTDSAFRAKRAPFFFEYEIGPSYMNNGPLSTSDAKGYSVAGYIGKWLTSAIGFRMGVSGTNTNWQLYGQRMGMYTRAGIAVDGLLNPFGFTRHYNWDNQFGLNLLGGYEYGRVRLSELPTGDMNKGKYIGYRVGAQIWTKITNDLRFNIEPMYIAEENYYGRHDHRYRYDEFSVKAGLTVLFRSMMKRNRVEFNDSSLGKLYFGIGLGTNSSVYRWKYDGASKPFLRNGFAFLGYKFNDISAARLMGEYFEDQTLTKYHHDHYLHMRTTAISLDYELNLLNAMSGVNPRRRWGVSIYGGPSYAFGGSSDDPNEFGFNFGGQLSYRFTRNLSLFYAHNIYWLHNRYKKLSDQTHFFYGTMVNTFNLGLLFNFNSFNPEDGYAFENGKPFFVEYGLGMGSVSGTPAKGSDAMGTVTSGGLGLWFTPYLGARATFELQKGGASTEELEINGQNHTLYNQLGMGYGNIDVLINPFGFKRNYNMDDAKFGVNLFVGYRNGYYALADHHDMFKGQKMYFGGLHYGAQFWTKLTQDLRFFIQPTFAQLDTKSIYYDPETFELSKERKGGYETLDLGNNFTVKAGLTLFLRSTKNREEADDEDLFDQPYFYAGVGGGWNTPLQNRHFESPGSKINGIIFGGYRFSQYSGVRASFEFFNDGITEALINKDYKGLPSYNKSTYSFGIGAVDYQLDILSAFSGYKATRRWGASIYAGLALGYGFSSDKKLDDGTKLKDNSSNSLAFGGNAGIIADYRFSSNWAVFFNHNMYGLVRSSSSSFFNSPALVLGKCCVLSSFNIGIIHKF